MRPSNKGVLPPRGIKDIKKEVEGRPAPTFEVKAPEKKKPIAPKKTEQVPLIRIESEPEKKPSRPKKLDLPESKIINVKAKPDLSRLIEVKDYPELEKLKEENKFINRFEDKKEKIYFIGEYFYRE